MKKKEDKWERGKIFSSQEHGAYCIFEFAPLISQIKINHVIQFDAGHAYF